MYLSYQKAVITRQWDRHCGQVDINGLAISDSLETAPHEARNLESIYILQPHQPLSGPLEVFQFGKICLFLLVTRPEGWTAEGQNVNWGGWVMTAEKSGCLVITNRCVCKADKTQPCVFSRASSL